MATPAAAAASMAALCWATRLPSTSVLISSRRSQPSKAPASEDGLVEVAVAHDRARLREVGDLVGPPGDEHDLAG